MGRQEAVKEIMKLSFENNLGVKKWEVRVAESRDAALGSAPNFFPRPGWERAQNVLALFSSDKRDTVYQITEKLDGASMTVFGVAKGSKWYKALPELPRGWGPAMENSHGRVGVCGQKNEFIDDGKNLYWETAKRLGLPDKLASIGDNVAIQGELCGSSIENNTMGFPEGEHAFFVFSIWDIDRQRYMPVKQVEEVCKSLKLRHAPVVSYARLGDFAKDMDELLAKAEGTGIYGQIREGLVFKTLDGKDHFKVIANSWLVKTDK
jgi:RNA ligase (TIGR02306 family)